MAHGYGQAVSKYLPPRCDAKLVHLGKTRIGGFCLWQNLNNGVIIKVYR